MLKLLIFKSFHPTMPLLASTSGQRQFLNNETTNENDSDSESDKEVKAEILVSENSLKIWKHSLF